MFTPLRAALVVALCVVPSAAMAQSTLTLDEAFRRALEAAPQTASFEARTTGLGASRTAAGLRPAPTVEVLTENFGPGGSSLYNQFQVTGSYSQRIERGGKRDARIAVVDRDMDLLRIEAVITRLDILAAVQRLYVEVQATEALITVQRERLKIAEQVQREVKRRVASARDPLFAGMRAETAVSEAGVDLELAIHARDAALARLAAYWGGSSDGLLVPAAEFIAFDRSEASYQPSTADLALLQARGARADAITGLQRTQGVRDVTVSGGPRFIGTGDVGFTAGVSIPLGGRRLNNARVAEGQSERRRIDADLNVERVQRARAIALAVEKLTESRHEAEAIRDRVIPNAELTLDEVRVGYNRGFFSFLDVSNAQTALANARARLIDAARRYHEAGVELDRLTGRFANIAEEA